MYRYREFKELQGRCERLLEARKMLDRCKEDLDEALKVMLNASKDLEKARAKEEELAELISDDHVEADHVSTLTSFSLVYIYIFSLSLHICLYTPYCKSIYI